MQTLKYYYNNVVKIPKQINVIEMYSLSTPDILSIHSLYLLMSV